MSSVNYSLKHKGVRLVSSDEAWIKGKKGIAALSFRLFLAKQGRSNSIRLLYHTLKKSQ